MWIACREKDRTCCENGEKVDKTKMKMKGESEGNELVFSTVNIANGFPTFFVFSLGRVVLENEGEES